MIDVLGIALVVVAVTLILEPRLPQASIIGTGVWLLGCAALIFRHGAFPGFSYGVAALTAGLSLAIVALPLVPRLLVVSRGIAGTAAVAAALGAGLGGVLHG